MKDFYVFAERNPWLTFFLVACVCEAVGRIGCAAVVGIFK
jgi:hypothetical protein